MIDVYCDTGGPNRPSVRLLPVLSPAERECLELAAHGLTAKEIARRRGCSERTVDNTLYSLRGRLNVRNTAHAVARALSAGWICFDPAFWEEHA